MGDVRLTIKMTVVATETRGHKNDALGPARLRLEEGGDRVRNGPIKTTKTVRSERAMPGRAGWPGTPGREA